LYEILKANKTTMNSIPRASSQSSSSLVDQQTPSGSHRRVLIYRKSQSPTKAEKGEEEDEEDTNEDSYHYDPKHDLAIKVSGLGMVLQSKKYKQLGCGARVYLFTDGSTWQVNPHIGPGGPQDVLGQDPGAHYEEDDEEEDDEQGDQQGDGEVGGMVDEEDEETKPPPKGAEGKGKGKGKGKKQVVNKLNKTVKGKGKGKNKGRVVSTKDIYKTRERHREHSKIWHQVFNKEKKKGASDEAAKIAAGGAATAHCKRKFG